MADLSGKVVLVADDDPALAIDLAQRFTAAGALVVGVRTVADGLRFAEEDHLSVAVVDCRLVGGDCGPICERLAAHGIPVVFFCEEADVQRACTPREIISKSADPAAVIDTAARLLCSSEASGRPPHVAGGPVVPAMSR